MTIKIIICNCNGLKFMPENLDMNTLPFELEADKDVAYAVVHPQLCGRGGLTVLGDLLRSAQPDDYFVVAGCGPENQTHFLGCVTDELKFPEERFVGVNIRGMNNDQARTAVLEAAGRLLTSRTNTAQVDAFGG